MVFEFKEWWGSFWYNFGWSDWVGYIDGWIPRLSLSVPLIGYLILFNHSVGRALEFVHLTNEATNQFGLNGSQRLRFIYFGLLLLGTSNFIYKMKKPYAFRLGTNMAEYVRACLEVFTLGDFITLHSEIRSQGHFTQDGKYYDSEWKGFLESARNEGEGTDRISRTGSWDAARSRYGSLLRSI